MLSHDWLWGFVTMAIAFLRSETPIKMFLRKRTWRGVCPAVDALHQTLLERIHFLWGLRLHEEEENISSAHISFSSCSSSLRPPQSNLIPDQSGDISVNQPPSVWVPLLHLLLTLLTPVSVLFTSAILWSSTVSVSGWGSMKALRAV